MPLLFLNSIFPFISKITERIRRPMILKENSYICLNETNFDYLVENCLESVSASHKVTVLDFCNTRYFFPTDLLGSFLLEFMLDDDFFNTHFLLLKFNITHFFVDYCIVNFQELTCEEALKKANLNLMF